MVQFLGSNFNFGAVPLHLLPVVLMISDLGKKRHHLNCLLSRWMWIPSLTCQVFSVLINPTKKNHWEEEVDVKCLLSTFWIWFVTVNDKERVELLLFQTRGYNLLKVFYYFGELLFGWALTFTEC